jgi:hypothetical protein
MKYGPANGPLGFPMTDRQAFAVDAILKQLPGEAVYRYRKAIVPRAPTELMAGERSDVSWISEESPDRDREVVMARGMNDAHFQLNPIVTLNHDYQLPPVGRSLWRRRVTDGPLVGIKAKTHYPARPADWPPSRDWPADIAFTLVHADLLRGKSIGFLPTKVHIPTDTERDRPGWTQVNLVIDEWILLEYACVFLPAQQHAVLDQVSKDAGDAQYPIAHKYFLGRPPLEIPFVPVEELARRLTAAFDAWDPVAFARREMDARLDRLRGRV